MIPQLKPQSKRPSRVLLGSDGAPSPQANTRYYSVRSTGEVLIIRNGNTARMSRADTLSDLRGRLSRLNGYEVGGNGDCREQMMSAIEATIEALEQLEAAR